MLIESYVVEFSEVKRCLASLKANDLVIVSENIFALRENEHSLPQDLLSDNTPQNHPEALLLVNKDYARNLILNDEAFEFLKQSHDVDNMRGVTLHLAFGSADLIQDLQQVAIRKNLDGLSIPTVGLEALLMAQQTQQKRFKENQSILKKSIGIYRKDM